MPDDEAEEAEGAETTVTPMVVHPPLFAEHAFTADIPEPMPYSVRMFPLVRVALTTDAEFEDTVYGVAPPDSIRFTPCPTEITCPTEIAFVVVFCVVAVVVPDTVTYATAH